MNNNYQNFRPHDPDQLTLMPPDLRDWLPGGHLAYFVRDTVEALDLSQILDTYDNSRGGSPAYHPVMMTQLLVFGYSIGVRSSRKIERATHESVPFRVLAANQHPDHDTISSFRNRHSVALAGLFDQILKLCRDRGMTASGHVAIDGTKVRANASKHKAMSYGRMKKKCQELDKSIQQWFDDADRIDAEEDDLYGKGNLGNELPEEFRDAKTRRANIRKALKELEERKKADVEKKRAEDESKEKKQNKKSDKKKIKSSSESTSKAKTQKKSDKPNDRMQYNFTDPESRIMKMASTGSFEQCYNAQVAVDVDSQVIVAADVTQDANDKKQLEPMVDQVAENMGDTFDKVSVDTGYYSNSNADGMAERCVDAYIATGKIKHGEKYSSPRGRIPKSATTKQLMQRKLRTKAGRATYAKRKISVEPAIGQIKEVQGFRQFFRRGLCAAQEEWRFGCAIHNILKLFRRAKVAIA
jgi:transposase